MYSDVLITCSTYCTTAEILSVFKFTRFIYECIQSHIVYYQENKYWKSFYFVYLLNKDCTHCDLARFNLLQKILVCFSVNYIKK